MRVKGKTMSVTIKRSVIVPNAHQVPKNAYGMNQYGYLMHIRGVEM